MIIKDQEFVVKHSPSIHHLYILSDIHFGSEAFLEEEFDRMAGIIQADPHAILLFLGDITDADRPSSQLARQLMYHDRREAYRQEDDQALAWIDMFVMPRLKKLIGNKPCLGMLDGDHFRRLASGLTSVQYICSQFKGKVPYLGDGQAAIRLHYVYHQNQRCMLSIHAQHGIGGGGRTSTNINRLEDTANNWQGMDCFVRGHSHKSTITPISKYYVNRASEIKQKDIWLINTPSFRTGFVKGFTDYAEKRNYGATAHKFPILKIRAVKKKMGNASKAAALMLETSGELV